MNGKVTACPVLLKRRREQLERFLRDNSFRNPQVLMVDEIRGTARIAFDVSLAPEQTKKDG